MSNVCSLADSPLWKDLGLSIALVSPVRTVHTGSRRDRIVKVKLTQGWLGKRNLSLPMWKYLGVIEDSCINVSIAIDAIQRKASVFRDYNVG